MAAGLGLVPVSPTLAAPADGKPLVKLRQLLRLLPRCGADGSCLWPAWLLETVGPLVIANSVGRTHRHGVMG